MKAMKALSVMEDSVIMDIDIMEDTMVKEAVGSIHVYR